MNKQEFIEAFRKAGNEDVVNGIRKRWSAEQGGYWYLAHTGEHTDNGINIDDFIENNFFDDADENCYVEALGARI